MGLEGASASEAIRNWVRSARLSPRAGVGSLRPRGRGRGGKGRGAGWLRSPGREGIRLAALGIQALEFFEGAVVVAVGGIDAALEAGELLATVVEAQAHEALRVRFPDLRFLHFALPELGFGLAEAAEEPLAIDEGIDQEALLGGGGLPTLLVFGGEGLEIGGVLAANDLRFGVNAGLDGVEAGDGLALDGARAGGFLCVETIRFDLLDGGHKRKGQAGPGSGLACPAYRVARGVGGGGGLVRVSD